MAEKIRVVHYLNQFFAQIGGEEKADIGPGFKEGPIGPGRALQQALGQPGEVVATCFCGDNYFAEHLEEATEELLRQMASFKPQLLIAGATASLVAPLDKRPKSDWAFLPWPAWMQKTREQVSIARKSISSTQALQWCGWRRLSSG
jgi:hypothetical protein